VIIPSYTFVSTAIAFVRQGAKIVFADSYKDNPNIDADKIEALITSKTKAIIPVHYAGVACDMDKIMALSVKYNLIVIEDAAQAIDSFYTGKDGIRRALGSIGHMAAFSFHETKNIISGEGGMLTINDAKFEDRAEIIWEKGTNRSQFFRGEVNKYGWVDTGSSFLPSEVITAFLWAQIENIEKIQTKRKELWKHYYNLFEELQLEGISLPILPEYATNNAHMFYLVFINEVERNKFITKLKNKQIYPVFHYISLHSSEYYTNKHDGRTLVNADKFTECLVRLPLYFDLNFDDINHIINIIKNR
jgi:dTDP-4-amino-4,6-dideoxygalactose transaminase